VDSENASNAQSADPGRERGPTCSTNNERGRQEYHHLVGPGLLDSYVCPRSRFPAHPALEGFQSDERKSAAAMGIVDERRFGHMVVLQA
jgi:hypothetical protein